MIYADLHSHTRYSPDATAHTKTIIERLNNHPTIKALAITDHNTNEGYFKVHELAKPYPDILIIPGVEISAKEGETILLGTTELPPEPWTVQNIIDHAKTHDAITIAPHPYRGLGLADKALKFDLDAIETLNGITSPSQNRQAQQLAKTKNLPGVAGSDAHFDADPWNVCTEIQATLDVDEILKAIRKGNARATYTEKSIHF